LKEHARNLKKECAGLVVGMAVFTGQISPLDLRYKNSCSIDNLSPNSLFAAEENFMFTFEQINDIHDRLGNAETLAQYLEALKNIGVDKYDSFITDGHSEYFGKDGHKVVSPPVHEKFSIAETSNRESFLKHLDLHNQRTTSYLEMSKGLADSGIEKWTFDTNKMTITYYGKDGNEILVESIK
jgi:uncharacterized protein YbcV (DUF1398 family)